MPSFQIHFFPLTEDKKIKPYIYAVPLSGLECNSLRVAESEETLDEVQHGPPRVIRLWWRPDPVEVLAEVAVPAVNHFPSLVLRRGDRVDGVLQKQSPTFICEGS